MKYSDHDIDRVRKAADIRNFVPNLSGRGASQYTKCPQCGKEGKNKGLCVTHKGSLDIAKCFSCGFTLNGAIDAEMHYSNVDFPEALRRVASRSGVFLESEEEKRQRSIDASKRRRKALPDGG